MKVSVIIPMYNAEKTILKCLESIVYQLPIDQFEIVIVDDGSKDNCAEIVKYYIENNNFDIGLIQQENKGVSTARNRAIKAAKYDLIALIDSDDIWLPNKLKHQLEIMSQYDLDFIGTLHNNMRLGFPYKVQQDIIIVSLHRLLIKMAPSTITSLFKKELIEKAGYYDESQKYTEDGNLWLRFSKIGKMAILNKSYAIAGDFKPLYGHSGLSGNLKEMYNGEIKNLKDIYNLNYLNFFQLTIYYLYTSLKYYRRLVVVALRRILK
ncbi:glycosyltransferase family 2 protein [Acinetobacter guillouiae]|uniref:glycosyltransferase family 2 protein n=1 Tax=Acinetobacter guillouiae TaxID=106649 RepID=UPI0026E1864B|nr:glycosyltransferase family A protein [Acinetobacter guillouiae]MDO6645484.1 glycosyltransferase family A protein [Acinetobacter guillouiae]